MEMNMEDEELVKMVNPTLKRRETILFFLIVVINGLKCIVSDIGLDTCTRGRWRVEVSKLEMNQPLGFSVTKFSQPRGAWISLKRASAAPQSKLCCVIPFFILIIFRSIIQFLVVLCSLLLWLHQHLSMYNLSRNNDQVHGVHLHFLI